MADKLALKRSIDALDFALYELTLYLDTHPDDERALRTRQAYAEKRDTMLAEYERQFGAYIVTTADVPLTATRWAWVDDPWPWEYAANCGTATKEG